MELDPCSLLSHMAGAGGRGGGERGMLPGASNRDRLEDKTFSGEASKMVGRCICDLGQVNAPLCSLDFETYKIEMMPVPASLHCF